MGNSNIPRCEWCLNTPQNTAYHDKEWGVPAHDDAYLFHHLVLGGAQAGLSWITILKRRDNYLKAFDYFDVEKIAGYGEEKFEELMQDEGIIRNEKKIISVVNNARAFLKVKEEKGSFDKFLWDFFDGKQKHNAWKSLSENPAKTPESERLSDELIRRGFRFVGPTIMYAFMQAVGIVNDHTTYCFRHKELTG